jgi:hypothetical protein
VEDVGELVDEALGDLAADDAESPTEHFPPEGLLGTRFRLRFPFPLGFASQRIHVRVLGHTSA